MFGEFLTAACYFRVKRKGIWPSGANIEIQMEMNSETRNRNAHMKKKYLNLSNWFTFQTMYLMAVDHLLLP